MDANEPQHETNHEPTPSPLAKPSRFARFRKALAIPLAALRFMARLVFPKTKNPWLRKSPAVVIGMGLVIAFGWRLAQQRPVEVEEKPPVQWADVRQHLEDGNFREARIMAAHLRARDDVPYDEMGAAPYAFGAAALHDADSSYEESIQRKLYLIAARYFEEASIFGFPPEKKAQALADWGRALYSAGKYARSLPVLTQAYELEGSHRAETARILASAYFRDGAANVPRAREIMEKYLAEDSLSADDRFAGTLEYIRILLRLGDLKQARTSIESLDPERAKRREVTIVRVWRQLLEWGANAKDSPKDGVAPPKDDLRVQVETLKTLLAKSAASNDEARQATYLLGLCYMNLGEAAAAKAQFDRLRRVYANSPEAMLASLEIGDMYLANGKNTEAVLAYADGVRDSLASLSHSPMWISAAEIQRRIVHAYEKLRDADDKLNAIALAQQLTPLFASDQALQLQVEAEVALAEKLEREAVSLSPSERKRTETKARAVWRNASVSFSKLAQLRYTTREYPELLWRGSECRLNGRDYEGCEREITKYMEEEPRKRRAGALTFLGAAQAALGKDSVALANLNECIINYSGEPAVFKARLVAAELHESKGNLVQARQFVRDNLESSELSPSSIEWRLSLLTLGRLWHSEGMLLETQSRQAGVDSLDPDQAREGLKVLEQSAAAFRQAIRALEEIVARFPDGPQSIEARFLVAESYRGAARLPRKKMPSVTIETLRANLQRELQELLQKAVAQYEQLERTVSEKQEHAELSQAESKMLRDGYFGHAESLFDLARYEEAIRAYSSATNRYQREPEALEAYLQIAACYRRLNRPEDARGTLEQAKVVLLRLREDAPFLVTSRYHREDWAQYIDWMGSL